MTIGYLSQNPDFPVSAETVYESLRDLDPLIPDEKLRRYAAAYGFRGEDIGKRINHLSGGERSRLAMARLFYEPRNLLLLDEPTNHLDVDSREALEGSLNRFSGTLVTISHDLYFIQSVCNRFWKIVDGAVREFDRLDELTMDTDSLAARESTESRAVQESKRTLESMPSGLSKNERFRRERELKKLEARIGALEQQKQKLVSELEEETDFKVLAELGKAHDDIDRELDAHYERWEQLAAELVE